MNTTHARSYATERRRTRDVTTRVDRFLITAVALALVSMLLLMEFPRFQLALLIVDLLMLVAVGRWIYKHCELVS